MPSGLQSGDDVTALMNAQQAAPKSGDDVTALMKPQSGSLAPSYLQTVEDRLIGVGKRVMRAGQQIGNLPKIVGAPGLAEGTDKVFGLPPGTSWNLSEPSNAAQKAGSEYAQSLGMMTAGAAMGPSEATMQAAGRTLEDQATKIQTAVDRLNKTATKTGGAWGYVMRGHPLQGIYAGLARLGANLSADGLEALGQTISDDPAAAGKLADIVEKATTPNGPAALTDWQAKFIGSVSDQLNSGKALSGLQKQHINVLY